MLSGSHILGIIYQSRIFKDGEKQMKGFIVKFFTDNYRLLIIPD